MKLVPLCTVVHDRIKVSGDLHGGSGVQTGAITPGSFRSGQWSTLVDPWTPVSVSRQGVERKSLR